MGRRDRAASAFSPGYVAVNIGDFDDEAYAIVIRGKENRQRKGFLNRLFAGSALPHMGVLPFVRLGRPQDYPCFSSGLNGGVQ